MQVVAQLEEPAGRISFIRAAAIELVRLEGVNHVLQQAPAERSLNLATYSVPGLPLAPGAADRIAAFITASPRAP